MTFQELLERVKKYSSSINFKRLEEAYHFAEQAHAGQTRMSGDPYITHPLAVAGILAEYKADEESLLVALLHDVVEDSHFSVEEIEKKFGKEVAKMVFTLTKLPYDIEKNGEHRDQFDNRIESIRKIFEVMQEDVRVIVIKLCDRLHNMQSLFHFRPEKQKRIAQETLDIYVKIADRLSIIDLKDSLEEFCIRYLYPELYQKLQEEKKEANENFKLHKKNIHEKIVLCEHLPKAKDIIFRQIIPYEKIFHNPSEEIFRIDTEVYVIMEKEQDCYLALREVHSLWRNIRDHLRDYIHLPKSNGYQALETRVLKRDGTTVKFIVQTEKMYQYFCYGVTLHCFSQFHTGKKIHLPWIEYLKSVHSGTREKSRDYLTALKNDIFQGSITVFTADNKALFLPPQSTALDAAFHHLGQNAFRIHGIFLNGEKCHFSASLKESDRINFELKNEKLFSNEWRDQINTELSRILMQEKLKEFPIQKRRELGMELLQNELSRLKLGFLEEISEEKKKQIARILKKEQWSEVLDALAIEELSTDDVLKALYPENGNILLAHFYTIQIFRKTSDPQFILKMVDVFAHTGFYHQHQKTLYKKYDDTYLDEFLIQCRSSQLKPFLQKLKALDLAVEIEEYNPNRTFRLYTILMVMILAWASNPFFVQYFLSQHYLPLTISTVKMSIAGFILFLYVMFRRAFYEEKFEQPKLNGLFFFVTFFLTFDFILTNFALKFIPGTHYIAIISLGLIFTFFITNVINSYKKISSFSASSLLSSLLGIGAIMILFAKGFETKTLYGYLAAIAVLITFFLHSSLNARYQRKQKIQNRALLQLMYMLLLGGVMQIPFLDLNNLFQGSHFTLFLLIINGITVGALCNWFYIEIFRYWKQHQIDFGLSFILPLSVVIDQILHGFFLSLEWISFLLIFIGVQLSIHAQRKRKIFSTPFHQGT